MPTGVKVSRFSHMNIVVDGLDASVERMRELFGAEFLLDLPGPDWHACLIEIGNVIIELFAPSHFMLHSRNGPLHLGIEYVSDVDEARAAVAAHDVGIFRDIVAAIHTDPADGFGVDFEFYAGSFHENNPPVLTQPIKPLSYWRDEHPLGLTGQKGYTHAVADIVAASQFMQSLLYARPAYEVDRPELGARAVGLEVADGVVELLTPTGPGQLQSDMYRSGEGIRSTQFSVRDTEQTRRHFTDRGVSLIPGTTPGSIAVAPEENCGLLFEFAE